MSSQRSRPIRDLGLALSTLTILPVRVRWPKGERVDAPGYYPLVGVLVGAVGFGFARLAAAAGVAERAPLVTAGLLVALWALFTRMLHWDGLADVADGFGVHDRERRLEVMRDSSVGAFGVTAIALGVVLQTAAIAHLLTGTRAWALVLVPPLARFAATCAAWLGTAARPDGLGASVIGRPRVVAITVTVLTLAAIVGLGFAVWGVQGVVLSAAGVVLALVVPHLISMRIGGVTGDVMGASIVLVETILFVGCALAR